MEETPAEWLERNAHHRTAQDWIGPMFKLKDDHYGCRCDVGGADWEGLGATTYWPFRLQPTSWRRVAREFGIRPGTRPFQGYLA